MDFSSWINGFVVGLACGILIGLTIILTRRVKKIEQSKTENS